MKKEKFIMKVRKFKENQNIVTVPKEMDMKPGQYVELVALELTMKRKD